MSTETPIATAPELPLTEHTTESDNWNHSHQYMDTSDASDQQIIPANDSTTSTTSSTAYSFTGGALNNATFCQPPGKNVNGTSNIFNDNTTKAGGNSKQDDEKFDDSMYECNICLDTAKDAVVSLCGHLFCWPCLHQWLETKPFRKVCPVCKAAIGRDKVIPLYGRNSSSRVDPRDKVPPRPSGQRTEPEPNQSFMGFNFSDGFQMSFGIGAFPFGYFSSSFNFGEQRPPPPNRGTAQYENDQQLSKVFIYFALFCIAWLLFA